MKRHIPGLHSDAQNGDDLLEGLFLVRVDRANYRWHPQKPFFSIRLEILEPKGFRSDSLSGRLYRTPKALWRLNRFLRDFEYDLDLLGRDEVDEKALIGLTGVVRTSRKSLAGCSFLNFEGFAPARQWSTLSPESRPKIEGHQMETSDDLQPHAD